ncbi:hypothetical protein J2S42_006182 [Catenuloplanes indicus]|uniref:Uncharacterized protein n=1 Tax=Catenuloplanes indicus TaxID=137267 RepID=A0AAE4B2Y3_9ACTN|nr:hypothetical protein [Catenuloplanes indicus]
MGTALNSPERLLCRGFGHMFDNPGSYADEGSNTPWA